MVMNAAASCQIKIAVVGEVYDGGLVGGGTVLNDQLVLIVEHKCYLRFEGSGVVFFLVGAGSF